MKINLEMIGKVNSFSHGKKFWLVLGEGRAIYTANDIEKKHQNMQFFIPIYV